MPLSTDVQTGDSGHAGLHNAERAGINTLETGLATATTKLAGVANGATANASDAQLRDRATHTGTQTAASISDLAEAVQDVIGSMVGGVSGVTVVYDDAAGSLTITGSGGAGTFDAESARDALGAALVGAGAISIAVNDAADTITISTTATVNSSDATLLSRANHTGTQSADTVTDGTTNKAFLATERTKLTGVASSATANASDAQLRDRSTHTGAQAISSVTGLQGALDAKAPSTDIAKTALSTAVQTSLGKADTALQVLAYTEVTDFSGGNAFDTTSATAVNVPGLSATFNLPASGVAYADMDLYATNVTGSSGKNTNIELIQGASTIIQQASFQVFAAGVSIPLGRRARITGTPGASVTVQVRMYQSGGSTARMYADPTFPASLRVTG